MFQPLESCIASIFMIASDKDDRSPSTEELGCGTEVVLHDSLLSVVG